MQMRSSTIAIAANDGSVYIKDCKNMSEVEILPDYQPEFVLQDAQEWVEALSYSINGSYLAVGSHDHKIYIYDHNADYALVGVCEGHTGGVTAIDWNLDENYIRSVSDANELLFH